MSSREERDASLPHRQSCRPHLCTYSTLTRGRVSVHRAPLIIFIIIIISSIIILLLLLLVRRRRRPHRGDAIFSNSGRYLY